MKNRTRTSWNNKGATAWVDPTTQRDKPADPNIGRDGFDYCKFCGRWQKLKISGVLRGHGADGASSSRKGIGPCAGSNGSPPHNGSREILLGGIFLLTLEDK